MLIIVTKFVDVVNKIYDLIPFSSATWLVLGVLSFFIWLFAKASRDPKSAINWEDLFLDHDTGKVSPYKLGFMVGMIVGTWVIVNFADSGKLTWDLFVGYLAFLVGANWSAAQSKKYAVGATSVSVTDTASVSAPAPDPAPKVDDVVKP